MDEILEEALKLRISDKIGMKRKKSLAADDPRRISLHLAPIDPLPSKEIYAEQVSRLK